MSGRVMAVSLGPRHAFSKQNQQWLRLVAGQGVEGDVHAGASLRHRSGAPVTPATPNLRQVHLLHAELFEGLATQGFHLAPGDIGENITTRDVDLLSLPAGTRLHLGGTAVVRVTGLRAPCSQLDRFQKGLKAAMLARNGSGPPRPQCGIMGVVLADGEVRPGDPVRVELPPEPHEPLPIL